MAKRLKLVIPKLALKIPPLALLLLVAVFMWAIARWLDTGETYSTWQGLLLMLFVAAGLTVISVAVFTLYKLETTVDPRDPGLSTKLVTVGLYNYSRNPMYLGLILLLVAWNIHLSSLYACAGLPLFIWAITQLQIAPEEQQLSAKFGTDYVDYCASVRRWL